MRPPVAALCAHLRDCTREAREAAATELYDPKMLRLVLTGRASAGFDQATIAGPEGVDLRETAAAKAGVAWLTEMKLDQVWEMRGGASASTFDLIVTWRPRAV